MKGKFFLISSKMIWVLLFLMILGCGGSGDSSSSGGSSTNTGNTVVPSKPTHLLAFAVSTNQINLTWNDNSDNESSFDLERSLSADFTDSEMIGIGPNAQNYSNTGLTSATTYYYRIRAHNSAGYSVYSNTISLNTTLHYIRPGATGNNDGTDWTNAWTDLPSVKVRGDTYYIADGDYGSYTLSTAASGTSIITLKKATADDHGTDTGWNSGYGDGKANFKSFTITTPNWVLDGRQRSGYDSGYGFYIQPQTGGNKIIRISGGGHVTLRYLELEYLGKTGLRDDGIYAAGATPPSNIVVQYCYLHDIATNLILLHGGDNVIEYCKLARLWYTAGSTTHGQGVQLFSGSVSNMIIRYNIFEDMDASASIACGLGANNLYIYGNVFTYTPEWSSVHGQGGVSPGQICDLSGETEVGVTNLYIYNNTFANQPSGNSGIHIGYSPDGSVYVYNNLWINNSVWASYFSSDEIAHRDFNAFYNTKITWNSEHGENDVILTDNPCSDPGQNDFRLKTATPAGVTLPFPYNKDSLGNIRGQDGIWDRGAFEYIQ